MYFSAERVCDVGGSVLMIQTPCPWAPLIEHTVAFILGPHEEV